MSTEETEGIRQRHSQQNKKPNDDDADNNSSGEDSSSKSSLPELNEQPKTGLTMKLLLLSFLVVLVLTLLPLFLQNDPDLNTDTVTSISLSQLSSLKVLQHFSEVSPANGANTVVELGGKVIFSSSLALTTEVTTEDGATFRTATDFGLVRRLYSQAGTLYTATSKGFILLWHWSSSSSSPPTTTTATSTVLLIPFHNISLDLELGVNITALSGDETTLSIGLSNGSVLLMTKRGEEVRLLSSSPHQSSITTLQQRGDYLVSVSWDDGAAALWSLKNNSLLHTLRPSTPRQRVYVWSAEVSVQTGLVLVGGGGTEQTNDLVGRVQLFSIADGKLVANVTTPLDVVMTMSLVTPSVVALGGHWSNRSEEGKMVFLDLGRREQVVSQQRHSDAKTTSSPFLVSLAWSVPTRRLFSVGADGTFLIFGL